MVLQATHTDWCQVQDMLQQLHAEHRQEVDRLNKQREAAEDDRQACTDPCSGPAPSHMKNKV